VIPGLRVGHATDVDGLTGCTVALTDTPAVGGIEIRGWAAGVHGLEFLDARHLVTTLDGVVLAGGSAFGLEAIWGVMQYLEERGVGFRTSQTAVPHVAGAIIYDLGLGNSTARPDRAMGYRAAAAARPGPVAEGNVGAGTGASVGKLNGLACATKGGLGCAVTERDGVHVGAIMVVNAVGDVRDHEIGRLIAGSRDAPDGRRLIDTAAALAAGAPRPVFRPTNTTIGLVAATAALDKAQAGRLAQLAMEGYRRALSPPHLDTDGDALFALSVGRARGDVEAIGRVAAELVARGIVRAVRAATAAGGLPAARDLE
jgi:L-aminopeptidase/D-esterase-like protein